MRIAIMTWFHHDNYGTVLQVVALSRKLESFGHHVEIIRYYPSGKRGVLPTTSLFAELYTKALKKITKRSIVESNSGKSFVAFRKDHLKLTDECERLSDLEALNEQFDAFICGSDQIWSPLCFDAHYFLDFVSDAERMIAYAPSVGAPKITDPFIGEQVAKLAKRFKHISTREESGSEIIGSLVEKEIPTVLDPTLLLDAEDWSNCLKTSKEQSPPYLLAYFLGRNEKHWRATYELGKKLKLPVKVIPVLASDLGREGVISTDVGPKEFAEYIMKADYVCTDSFHGVTFSINGGRNFCCFERFAANDSNNQNSRIYNLLGKLDLGDRLYKPGLTATLAKPIDYLAVQKKLADLRKCSQAFLLDALDAVDRHNQLAYKGKNNIAKDNTLCSGCGACMRVCPRNAIGIEMSEHGFYQASIDEGLCNSCGKCKGVCPFMCDSERIEISKGALFSYKDTDNSVLLHSSSGGIAYRLSCLLQEQGYAIVGCTFDREEQKARHILIEPSDKEGLHKLQGSKYMQSEFSPIMEKMLACKTPIAVFGTPCQIAGARNLLRERNDILYIDLICHGVPSYHLYKKYKELLRTRHNMDTSKMQIVFRYKPKGWRERYIFSSDSSQDLVTHQSKDAFFLMFEHGSCYLPACYECRWRDACSADLRIGDYWGLRFKKDLTGVSMVLSVTEQGNHIIKTLANTAYGANLMEQNREEYDKAQQLVNNPKPVYYDEVLRLLQDKNRSLTDITEQYVLPFEKRRRVMKRVHNIYDKVKQWR